MRFSEWEPLYKEILSDMGFDRESDESCAKMLRMIMINADLADEDDITALIGNEVSVFGGADSLADCIRSNDLHGTLISAGSATKTVIDMGIVPDIVVTDLDGDIDSQLKASEMGAITLIHAHGDNAESIMRYAKEFKGKVMLTTQSNPDLVICNFGGFTDGDRAVCLAREFGAERIYLYGFDFEHPSDKKGSDPQVKIRKLSWAKRIIGESDDIIIL